MKMNLWLMCLMMTSASLLAQEAVSHSPYSNPDSNAPAAESQPAPIQTPPPAPPAPASTQPQIATPAATLSAPPQTPARQAPATPKRASTIAQTHTAPLQPGPAVVAASRVNVRAKAGLKSEVLTQLSNGDTVTVLEEITLPHSGPEEPSAWAKILLPQKAQTWVFAKYVSPDNKTVTAKKLNVRGGPGENYAVLGTLQRGDAVNEIKTQGNWMQIAPPTNAAAFMAAQYLTQEAAELAAAAPATTAPVTEGPPIAQAQTSAGEFTPSLIETNALGADTNLIAAAAVPEAAAQSSETSPESPGSEEPPPLRIVQREGIVRFTGSIQAPTIFQLVSPENRRPINYLYTTSTNLDLNRYKGLHIIVTGEEGLDSRWPNTPIITIQRIEVLD